MTNPDVASLAARRANRRPGGDGGEGRSQAAQLVALARDRFRCLVGDDGRSYAVALDSANLARPLSGRGGSLRSLLARLYADLTGGTVPSASALTDAITVLDGDARSVDPELVHLRLAQQGDGVVIDLGTSDGRCVEVRPGRWRRLPVSPVLFRRTALTNALPDPIHPAPVTTADEPAEPHAAVRRAVERLDALRALLNVDETRFRLLVAWLVAALYPEIAHPILALYGEQGTAKSTAARMLVSLIDPSPAPLRSQPRDLRTWAVTASASWCICLDNCSGFPAWFSDTLCKAVTGDGVVERTLHTDDEVTVLAYRRVIALTAIDTGALRGDLAERLLQVELDRIPEAGRRGETDLFETFNAAHPEVFGALLTLLAAVLKVLPGVELDAMPRMADFARLLAALDEVTGWTTSSDYARGATVTAEAVIDANPFATAIRDFMTGRHTWTGTTADLLAAITPEHRPHRWPETPQAAAHALRRIVPALRQTDDLEVIFNPRTKTSGRTLTINRQHTLEDPE